MKYCTVPPIPESEFQTRTGSTIEEAKKLLEKLGKVLDNTNE
jgi:hypothetical protein